MGAFSGLKANCGVLDLDKRVAMGNLEGSGIKIIQINRRGLGKIDRIYPAPRGRIMVHADDTLFIYDLGAKKVLHEMTLAEGTQVKQVHWTPNFSNAAIITSSQIYMVNKQLEILNS